MPPKRKGAAAKGAGGKKAKTAKAAVAEEEAGTSTVKDAIAKLKSTSPTKAGAAKVDSHCPLANTASVWQEFDCMLNQTNIGNNNNKYYVIQVLQQYGQYYAWNRWGRVGEPGQNAMKGPLDLNGAISEFKKKFKDKTKNDWDKRSNFSPVAGKYTLLEMDTEEEDTADTAEKIAKLDELDGTERVQAKCTLDKPTQDLVKLVFDHDMFKQAMMSMEIDVKKMPLGKLGKAQIAKGFECLEELEDAIKKKKGKYDQLTSRFYTLIPHAFGRQRPPVINDLETVQKKYDMLAVLGDIEMAQSMQKEKDKKAGAKDTAEIPHPLDVNYGLLQADLELLDHKSKEFKILDTYLKETEGYYKLKLYDIWKVNRHGEDTRFAAHDSLTNRKLLWHGTNVAVVAAIMKSGLRIMPHSGGRVGRGIYFASENGKSAGYVGRANKTGIMFLNEVVLGKEHHITRDDGSLVSAPKGHDCVIAKGRTEPDPKKDTSITIDGKKIVVPQGKPISQSKFSNSSFSQSEYLIYKESQNRIRYLLKLQFPY